MSVRVRRIETFREFVDLAPAWSELARASGQASPFLSHDWFWCCWQAEREGYRPEILVVEDSGGTLAILPTARWRGGRRALPVRRLGLFESPDAPWLDMLALGEPNRALAALLDHLVSRSDWDALLLQKLLAASPMVKALGDLLPGRLLWRRGNTLLSPYLTIAGTWEAFYRGKTQRFRKTCRNIENRIRRARDVVVEEHRSVDPDGPVFAEVLEVSRRSWKGAEGLAMATMRGMPLFFRELTRRASANGWLHLWILRLDGRAVATEYQIASGTSRHALRADFDEAVGNLSPGSYLNFRIVQSLFERGDVDEYDMGPVTNDYKLQWATGSHESVTLEAYAPTAYGRLLHGIETRLLPFARRWRDRAGAWSHRNGRGPSALASSGHGTAPGSAATAKGAAAEGARADG